jgi:hypothetical protein
MKTDTEMGAERVAFVDSEGNGTPIRDELELLDEVSRLLVRAETGGVAADFTELLAKVQAQMVEKCAREQPQYGRNRCARVPEIAEVAVDDGDMTSREDQEQRYAPRFEAVVEGVAIVAGERIAVEVVNLGAHGFGISAGREIRRGSRVLLELSGPQGVETFSCLVVFCRERAGGYHMGMSMVSALSRTA